MSWSDRVHRRLSWFSRAGAMAVLGAMALVVGGCTVQPLYGNVSSVTPGVADARIASIYIAEVDTRDAQEVRNHLIFLLNGGAGQPDNPQYRMILKVTKRSASTVTLQSASGDNEPTAGSVRLIGRYRLKDTETDKTVIEGERSATAFFDRPRQLFAESRAKRDAVDRAAREVAEFIRLDMMMELKRAQAQ